MIAPRLDDGGRFGPALLAVFLACWAALAVAPLPSHAANGESSSSTSAESGESEEGRDTEEEDTDAADANADDNEPASDWAAHLGNLAPVESSNRKAEPDLLEQRRRFADAISDWRANSAVARSLRRYDAAVQKADAATQDLYPEGRRTQVGEIDGVLAQHMADLFAAETALGPRVGDAIGGFKSAYTHESVRKFQAHILSRKQEFESVLKKLDSRYGDTQGQVPDREWAQVQEQRSQLRHVVGVTIPALENETGLYRMLKDSSWGNKRVADQKEIYVKSMQTAFRQEAAGLHDQQLFLTNARVRLADLERVGGAMGEVHKLVVDWDRETVLPPTLEGFNGGFKPDDGVDLDMNLNVTGVETAPTMRMGARAVAYARVAEVMGYGDMVPRTELAKIGGKYGVLQEWVDGEAPMSIKRRDLDYDNSADQLIHDQIIEARRWAGKLVRDYYDASESISFEGARVEMEAMRGTLDQYKPEFVQPEAQDPDAPRPPELIRILEAEHQSDAFREHDDAELRRQFAVAEILDRLTGQVDRHSYNFIISQDGRLMLIDNDQAFGHHTDAVNERYGIQSGFPEYIDSEMADRISALKPEDLRMATIGLLTGPEQEAVVRRLLSLQTRVQSARNSGKIIYRNPPQDGVTHKTWSNDGAALANARRSYYGDVAGAPNAPN